MSKIEMNKKYQTSDGKPVRILCVDNEGEYPVVGVVGGSVFSFTSEGRGYVRLVEVSPFGEFKDGDPVMVRCADDDRWEKRYFTYISYVPSGVFTYAAGKTKWSSDGCVDFWFQCRLPTVQELKEHDGKFY